VDDYYRDVIAPQLQDVRGRPVTGASLLPRDAASIHLQANYVVPSDGGALLVDAGDRSTWSEVHSRLHPSLAEFVVQMQVEDLYLIAPGDNTIVYSTSKDIDFSTSLVTGPHSGSALAALVESFPANPAPGVAAIADASTYAAANDTPSMFIASPVINDGRLAGYVALRFASHRLSSITTSDGSWRSLGDTGETYLVGSDGLMRSDARSFVEAPTAFVEAAREAGTSSEDQLRSMERLGTTALLEPASEEDVSATLRAGSRLVDTNNYVGQRVLSSQRALDIEGLDWVLFAEFEQREVDQPIEQFVRNLLIAIALFIVAITFLTARTGDRLLEPLRVVATRLREVRRGADIAAGESVTPLPDNSPVEFAQLAGDIDSMLATLSAHHHAAEARTAERRTLLRRILPDQVVKRAEAGERDVLDQIANATVAAIVIHGLGAVMRERSTDKTRDFLDDFIGEADVLAKKHGLDRVQLTGDAYVAACGTVRPHLDHAQRGAAFILDMRDLVEDLADGDEAIEIGGGLASGPITVGLTGGSNLVFDAWGPAMRIATDLARRAAPGEVLVSDAARSLLPSNFLTETGADAETFVLSRPTAPREEVR
jgi:class 3 adenylate cyclase